MTGDFALRVAISCELRAILHISLDSVLSGQVLVARRVLSLTVASVAALILVGEAQPASLTRRRSPLLLTAMNQIRIAARGCSPLRADARLERAARAHSSQMLRVGVFFHGAFSARIRSAGVHSPRIGENLAWASVGAPRASAIVRIWMASPEHRGTCSTPATASWASARCAARFSGHPSALMVTTDFAGRLSARNPYPPAPSSPPPARSGRGARRSSRGGARHARRGRRDRSAPAREAPARPG